MSWYVDTCRIQPELAQPIDEALNTACSRECSTYITYIGPLTFFYQLLGFLNSYF